MKEIKRRKSRKNYNWPLLLSLGIKTEEQFYKSTEWKYKRLEILKRDKFKCQFYLMNWNDGKHYPDKFKIIEARYVHHIKPLKDYPELCLSNDNLISLSFDAHEIVEERKKKFLKIKKDKSKFEEWLD